MKAKLKAKLGKFLNSRAGHGLLAAAALALAYVFTLWAIDSGSLLDWGIAAVLLVITIREVAAFIRQLLGNKQP